MDAGLLAWGRAMRHRARLKIAPLWLFTDEHRLPDPRAAARRLPKGLAGIVFRHDGAPGRIALGRDLARIARARRLTLVVAGDIRLAAALGAGVHLRGGRWPGVCRVRRGLITSSAHGVPDLWRARHARADLAFLSPAFPTASHIGAPGLGAARWCGMARSVPMTVAALGGVSGRSVRRLSARFCRAAGAIGALN